MCTGDACKWPIAIVPMDRRRKGRDGRQIPGPIDAADTDNVVHRAIRPTSVDISCVRAVF